MAAFGAAWTKNSFLQARYKRLTARCGPIKALVAVEHSIITAIWHMLHDNVPCHELGGSYYLCPKTQTTCSYLRVRVSQSDDLHRGHRPPTSPSIPKLAHTSPMICNFTMHTTYSWSRGRTA